MTNYLPKLLITGAFGQVGSALQAHAFAEKYQLIPCSHVQMDLTKLSTIEQAITQLKPHLVINTAAFTAVDKAETTPQAAMEVNYLGAANLATVCAKYRIPLLHLSTDYVFDGIKTSAYTEPDVANPINIYGQSKHMGEEVIHDQCKFYLILRVSGIFSEFGVNFLKTILRLADEKDEIRVVKDQITCPTDANDIAHTIYLLADEMLATKEWQPGIYHYCSQPPVSWYDFATMIYNEAQLFRPLRVKHIKSILARDYPAAAQRPAYSVLDCHKIKSAFAIEQPDWRFGISRVLASLMKSRVT